MRTERLGLAALLTVTVVWGTTFPAMKQLSTDLSALQIIWLRFGLAALVLLDAVTRLQPGVLNDAGSFQQDSFNPALDGLLDCPHYTRPEVWQGQPVPPELLSGHHGNIERWRRDQRLRITAQYRPELIAQARAQGLLNAKDEGFLAKNASQL